MKRTSKLCTALALFLILAFAITACGTTTGTNDKTTTASTEATASNTEKETSGEATKAALEPYEIVWYYDGPGPQKDVTLIEDEMNKYLKDKINVTVKLNALDWGTYDTKVQTLLATGEKIDLAFSCWALSYQNAVAKGWLTDLTDMLGQYAPETKKILEDNDWIAPQSINGRLYNLPCIKETGGQTGVIFNKTIVDQMGLDISSIKTAADLEPIYKAAKEKDPTVTPLFMCKAQTIGNMLMTANSTAANGWAYLDEATNTFASKFANPKEMEYAKLAYNFYKKGYINKDASTLGEYASAVKSGKVLSYPVNLKPGKDGEESKALGVSLVQVALSDIIASQGNMTGSMMAIPTTSKDPARALMFYNLFYFDEYLLNLMDYGVEGTHWVWSDKDKKIIDYAPATNGGKDSGWNHGSNWMFGNQLISYIFKGEDPEKWKKFDEFNKAAKRMPDFGFSFDSEPVKKEMAALSNISEQYSVGLSTGFMDPEKYFPEMEKKAKAAGLDAVITELNKQYDAFKAKQ